MKDVRNTSQSSGDNAVLAAASKQTQDPAPRHVRDDATVLPVWRSNDEETVLPPRPGDEATVVPQQRADDATVLPVQPAGDAVPPAYDKRPAGVRFDAGDYVIGGRYRIISPVSGGMEADAYLGERVADEARVFIKHQKRPRTDARAWLLEKLSACKHPNLVRLLDFELSERPVEVYLHVAGESLADILRRGERVSDGEIANLIAQLAGAVQHLHQTVGVAHRDIKPDNILVQRSDRTWYVLADFGVMTMVDSGGYTNFAGTRKYAAPESRLRGLERRDFLPYDWWSIGRVVQELAEGEHPYDRIKKLLPNHKVDAEAIAFEWDKILFEDDPATYGRAGQIEHGRNTRWRPLLRGLLTSDRQRRWSYDQVVRCLAGERVADSYDAGLTDRSDPATDNREALVAEIRRLSHEQHWNEAVQQVLENRGVYRRAKTELGDKRVIAKLELAEAAYAELTKDSFSTSTVEDVFTMLVLKAIGGERVPLSLGGYELSEDTLLKRAREDTSFTSDLFAALTRASTLRALEAFDTAAHVALRSFNSRWLGVANVLQSWNANQQTMGMGSLMIVCAWQTRAENDALISKARESLAHTENAALDAAFKNPKRSDDEAAALGVVLPWAQNWNFVSHESVRKAAAQGVYEQTFRLRQAYGWLVIRKYTQLWGFMHDPRTSWLLATVAVLPFSLSFSGRLTGAIIGYAFWIAVLASLDAFVKKRSAGYRRTPIFSLVALGVAVVGFLQVFLVESILLLVQAAAGGLVYLVIDRLRKAFIEQQRSYVTTQVQGGSLDRLPTTTMIGGYVKSFIADGKPSLNDVRADLIAKNEELAAYPSSWGFVQQPVTTDRNIALALTTIGVTIAGAASITFVAGIVCGLTHFLFYLMHALIAHSR